MKIELNNITIRQLVEGYADMGENGVSAFGDLLDVRPPYQREFVYDDIKREAVIDTVMNGFPLNVMYWARREDGTFEIIDGQQRTISICQYVTGEFSYMFRFFHNLQNDEQERFLDYELQIYICEGSNSEKLKWFKTINIAGEELTRQELRNAVFAGRWVSDAKRYFSKPNCVAFQLASKYLKGEVKRQEYLETAIAWISDGNIDVYMGNHQNDASAIALWNHFQSVISWVKAVFPCYRKEMKGIDWGALYRKYGGQDWDDVEFEREVRRLMADSDVESKKGIYHYVFDRDEHHLGIRLFDANTRREVYERQGGYCAICGQHFDIEQMDADHITPWKDGGRTVSDNCQMLCKTCNRRKSAK